MPQHIAIIMDGNRRWAMQQGKPAFYGHQAGSTALHRAVQYCLDKRIRYLSVYVFSTENWRRPTDQTRGLLRLFNTLLQQHISEATARHIQIQCLGDLAGLPAFMQQTIAVAHNQVVSPVLTLNLMINYGSHDEILRACGILAQQLHTGELRPETLTRAHIQAALYTADMPNPDIIIRTGNTLRLSNFMLWQAAYAELFFLPILWPEFTEDTLDGVVAAYHARDRTFGE